MAVTRLFDDNPSIVDLLGFDAVVAPIVDALQDPRLDPVTVGIHAPWGAGKTTVLHLLEEALQAAESKKSQIVVVRTSPWEYDDHDDVKGNLIGQVLGTLDARFGDQKGFRESVRALLKRVAWARVGRVVAKGAVTMQWDIDGLLDALTPVRQDGPPTTLAGFRDEFEELLDSAGTVRRVVVLVDDLDRCLPKAVMDTLEGIKLFLSVRRMAFVIAADTRMVQDAIGAHLGGTRRDETFARFYLDKIVQLPVSLPTLSVHDAEAYTALLLAQHDLDDDQFRRLIDHCRGRRSQHLVPFVGGFANASELAPSGEVLDLAARVTRGLFTSAATPREIKRFLNALDVRRTVAEERGVTLQTGVLAKLFVLENRHPDDFARLVGWGDADRSTTLEQWETWARAGDDEAPPPAGVDASTAEWAASPPSLVNERLGPYLTLAATLAVKALRLGSEVPDDVLAIRDSLVAHDSDAVRQQVATEASALAAEDRQMLVDLLLGDLRRAEQDDRFDLLVRGLTAIAMGNHDLAATIATGIRDIGYSRLTIVHVTELAMSEQPALVAIAREAADDEKVKEPVRLAAKQAFNE